MRWYSEPIASGSSSTSVDGLFFCADVSTGDLGQYSKVSSPRQRKQLRATDMSLWTLCPTCLHTNDECGCFEKYHKHVCNC